MAIDASLRQALHLLGLPESGPPPTKGNIQLAYVRAAQRCHPDSRHRPDANPCAAKFRSCHEAKRLLLAHYYNGGTADGTTSTAHGRGRSMRTKPPRHRFGEGFPFRTMRVLTLKQNLALRGFVMVALTVGTVWDEWRRRDNRLVGDGIKSDPYYAPA